MNEQPAAPDSGPSNSPVPESAASNTTPASESTTPSTPQTPATPDTPTVLASKPDSTGSAAAVATPDAPVPPPPPTPPPPAPAASSSGGSKLLPLLIAAIVPAVIVGVIVFFAAHGSSKGGGSGNGAGVLDGFFRLGPSSDGDISSYNEKLPPDFPKDFPQEPGSKVIASFTIASSDGTNYFAVFGGDNSEDAIYKYYLGALDKDPWQVEVARASDEFTGVRFSRPDNPDITGDVTVHHSDLDNKTVTYVSMEDASKKQASGQKAADQFKLPTTSRELPAGFPTDIPIYKGKTATATVTDTYFEKGQGGKNYIVSALTKDDEADVIAFYKDAFSKKGYTVTDGTPSSSASKDAKSIDFKDTAGQLSGSVRADAADADPSYVQVDLVLQVSGTKKGN